MVGLGAFCGLALVRLALALGGAGAVCNGVGATPPLELHASVGAPLDLRAGVRVWPALVLVGNVGELHASVWIPVCGQQGRVMFENMCNEGAGVLSP